MAEDIFLKTLIPFLGDKISEDEWNRYLAWPPDVYAICCIVLKNTGAYINVLKEWPSVRCRSSRNESEGGAKISTVTYWQKEAREIGYKWAIYAYQQEDIPKTIIDGIKSIQSSLGGTPAPYLPTEIKQHWDLLYTKLNSTVQSLRCINKIQDEATESARPVKCDLASALIELIAFADEASVWLAGGPISRQEDSNTYELLERKVRELGSLQRQLTGSHCHRVPSSWATVLPKHHTPKNGMNINSLSHYLSFHQNIEIVPKWNSWPSVAGGLIQEQSSFNLLLIPYPYKLAPNSFRPVTGTEEEYHMPSGYGLFEFNPAGFQKPDTKNWSFLSNLIVEANKYCRTIHGIVFPETSMIYSEFESVKDLIRSHIKRGEVADRALLIAGIGSKSDDKTIYSKNEIVCQILTHDGPEFAESKQSKHHRWRIEDTQIVTYGLADFLDSRKEWWEGIETSPRELQFFQLLDNFSICCLICEDLARQDPVSSLIRSIGPSLVIALLMDSAQITSRWPGRYATVLADDPGSSVLTLTSVGMVDMARVPPGKTKSRSVGLWQDPTSSATELVLEAGHLGILLTLKNAATTEYSADGRSDGDSTCSLRLSHWRSLTGDRVGEAGIVLD